MAAPVILIEASPRRAEDGAVQIVRLAGGGAYEPYFYGGVHWQAGVVRLPPTITSLDYDGTDLGAGGVPQAAELQWSPTNHEALSALLNLFWLDAAITVRIGPEGAMPPVVLTGSAIEAIAENGIFTIRLGDPVVALKKALLTERFGGTGNLEGPVEWEGKIRRRIWGRVWNLQGEPIDAPNNIFCFADPLRPLFSINAVRDKGAPAAALTNLAWQGSAQATLAALRAAQAPIGGGVVCPSIACVKWWTQPAGDLTADLKGEIGTGYVETTAQIAERIVQALGGPAFAAGTIAAASAARPAAVGWVAKDDSTTAAAMLTELLGNSSLLWILNTEAKIEIREWGWTATRANGRSLGVSRKKALRPVATRKIGYKRNELPTDRNNLAGIVLANDVLYPDGTPVAELQPAEAGATAGAPAGTKVGDRFAEEIEAELDFNAETLIEQTLRGDGFQELIRTRTLIDGEGVNTVLVEFTAQQLAQNDTFRNWFQLLGAEVDGGSGWILNAQGVRIQLQGESFTRSLEQLALDVNGQSGQIEDLREIVVDPSGATVRSMLRLTNDGYISGLIQTNGGPGRSMAAFLVDSFAIVDPNGGSPRTPFSVSDGVVKMGAVEVDTLKVGTGGTSSKPGIVSSGTTIAGSGAYVEALGTTVVMDGPGTIFVTASAGQSFVNGDKTWNCQLEVDGQLLAHRGGTVVADSVSIQGSLYFASAGIRTVTLKWNGQSGCSLASRNLFAIAHYGS